MACKGDAGEFCGGPNALSIYTKCTAGASCTNAGGATGVHNSTFPTVPSVAAVVKLPTSSSSAAASVVVAYSSAASSVVVAPKATNTPVYNPPSIMYSPSSLSTLVKAASQPAPTVAKAVATPSSSSSGVKTVYVTVSKSPCSS
jgi:hypothetical protein